MASTIHPPLRWSLPGGYRLAYSTVADGDQRTPARREAWLAGLGLLWPCVVPRQVHGVRVVLADAEFVALADADGVVSASTEVALGAYGADCPALVLAAPDAVGIAHCGWRGTAGGIVGELARTLAARSRHPPRSWHAFIAPGISGPSYEVDGPVLSARSWPAAALSPSLPGRAHLDVAATIAHDLQGFGVTDITASGVCTATDPRLWSYRKRGAGLVQLLVVWRE